MQMMTAPLWLTNEGHRKSDKFIVFPNAKRKNVFFLISVQPLNLFACSCARRCLFFNLIQNFTFSYYLVLWLIVNYYSFSFYNSNMLFVEMQFLYFIQLFPFCMNETIVFVIVAGKHISRPFQSSPSPYSVADDPMIFVIFFSYSFVHSCSLHWNRKI